MSGYPGGWLADGNGLPVIDRPDDIVIQGDQIVDVSKPVGAFSGASPNLSAATNSAIINAALALFKRVYVPGNIAGTPYPVNEIAFPVASHGGGLLFGDGPSYSQLAYQGAGRMITFGDGGSTDTRYQEIIGLELIGNINGLAAVYFNSTRWCAVRRCDIRAWSNANAHAIDTAGGVVNYYIDIEGVQFGQTNNRSDLRLLSTAAQGANSAHVYGHTHFSSTGANCDQNILIDGSDSVLIDGGCEFAGNPSGAGGTSSAIRATGTVINLKIKDNQFDGPAKAWDLGASVTGYLLRDNTGSGTALTTAAQASTDGYRDDVVTRGGKWSIYMSANLSVTNNWSVATNVNAVSFNTEEYDPLNMHASGTDVTIPAALAGRVLRLSLSGAFAGNATGVRMARIRLLRAAAYTTLVEQDLNPPSDGTSIAAFSMTRDIQVQAGDVFFVQVYQTSGGALNLLGGNTPGTVFQGVCIG